MCQRESCWKSFPPLVSLTSVLVRNRSRIFTQLSIFLKIKISIDQGMASVPMSLARSSGFSKQRRVTMIQKQRKPLWIHRGLQLASILTYSYFRLWAALSSQSAMKYRRLAESSKWNEFLSPLEIRKRVAVLSPRDPENHDFPTERPSRWSGPADHAGEPDSAL